LRLAFVSNLANLKQGCLFCIGISFAPLGFLCGLLALSLVGLLGWLVGGG
jgi:hypothetical protein